MRMRAGLMALFSILTVFITPVLAADQPLKFNMSPGVTPVSRDIYDLHMTIFGLCVVIGALVFGVLIYALIKHRKSVGHKSVDFHGSVLVEIIWTIIPFLILIVMAVPATMVLIRMNDDSKADINIKIVGYQWKWKYEYLDSGISYFSNLSTPPDQLANKAKKNKWYLLEVDKPLVLPIHKKIRFLVTSSDVIHSWWVPELGIKRDAIPGFVHEAWARIEKPGVYRGQCAELCGLRHGFMPIVVVAKTEAAYAKWVAEHTKPKAAKTAGPAKPLTEAQLMTEGEKVYATHCSACHKAGGEGMPPAFPALKGGKIVLGPKQGHIDIVLDGKSGTAMQAFKEQLNDEQIAAVITYERNSWGNKSGVVQPAEVAKSRK